MYRCPSCGAFNRVSSDRPSGQTAHCGKCKAAIDLSGAPQDVTEQAYAHALVNSPIPVVVDYWAPWCGPCRIAGPILDGIARGLAGKVLALKVNTDDEPGPSAALGIRGIPTFIIFRDGREVARQSGAMPAPAMSAWISQHTG